MGEKVEWVDLGLGSVVGFLARSSSIRGRRVCSIFIGVILFILLFAFRNFGRRDVRVGYTEGRVVYVGFV